MEDLYTDLHGCVGEGAFKIASEEGECVVDQIGMNLPLGIPSLIVRAKHLRLVGERCVGTKQVVVRSISILKVVGHRNIILPVGIKF